MVLPADEAYVDMGKDMYKSGKQGDLVNKPEYKHGKNVFGTIKMVFYDNYRRDKVGMYILKLSRFSHLLIRFPGLRKIVDKIVSEFPDNAFNRFVWKFTKNALNDRVHAGAPLSFFFKYFLFHRGKQVR